MLIVTLGSALMVALLVSFLLGIQGEWGLVPRIFGAFVIGGLGFFVIAMLIMWMVFGNRTRMRFMVTQDGVRFQTLDRTAKTAARWTLILGLLSGRPGAAGIGLLSMSQEMLTLDWSGAFRAQADPTHRTISLVNRWRTLMRVYCSADNFEAVRRLIDERIAEHGTAVRSAGPSPVGRYLLRTVLAVVASVPIFLLGDVYGHSLLAPLMLMCFAIATTWLVRHLAWVVLALVGLLSASMVAGALATRSSSFFAGRSYRRYETLSGDDWALTALAAAGLVYLCWNAVQVLRRRIVPAFESDLHDGDAD